MHGAASKWLAAVLTLSGSQEYWPDLTSVEAVLKSVIRERMEMGRTRYNTIGAHVNNPKWGFAVGVTPAVWKKPKVLPHLRDAP